MSGAHRELNNTDVDDEVYSHHECIDCGARQVVDGDEDTIPLAYNCPPVADDQHCLKRCVLVAVSNKGNHIMTDEEARTHAI